MGGNRDGTIPSPNQKHASFERDYAKGERSSRGVFKVRNKHDD